MSALTQDLVRNLFDYRDGKLYWRVQRGRARIGDEAGVMQGNGYRGVKVNRRLYQLHRVIFLHAHGFLPPIVDHIDLNILNNDISNLRAATISNNGANRRVGVTNTSGVKNVSWNRAAQKWTVMFHKNGRVQYFGRYKSLDEAQRVAIDARTKLFGCFARHT